MNALRIAEQLDAVPETGADPDLIQEAADELRLLHAEVERLEVENYVLVCLLCVAKPVIGEAMQQWPHLRKQYDLISEAIAKSEGAEMNAKHTPGPWMVDMTGADVAGTDGAFMPFGGCGYCDAPWSNAETKEQADANARLIAAAPDLLDALKDIVQLWDHHCYEHGDGKPSPLHVKASAAIAKAEG